MGPLLLVLSLIGIDSPLSSRGCACLEASASAFDLLQPGSFLPLRGCSCSGSVVLVLEPAHCGLSLSPQAFAHASFSPSAPGTSRLGSSPSVLDRVSVGSFPSLRGSAKLEAFLLAPDLATLGFFLLLRGTSCVGLVLPAPDFVQPGPPLFSRGCSRPGLAVPALDLAHLGLPPLLRSFS